MFATLFSAAALSLLAARAVRADFSLNYTSFKQCGSTHLEWAGQSGAVNIILVPAADPCDNTLVDLGDHSNGAMTWNVSLPAGTELLISAEDEAGDEAWSGNITVASSSDTSCLSAAQLAQISSTPAASTSSSGSTTGGAGGAGAYGSPSSSSDPSTTDSSASSESSSASGLLGAANAGIGPTVSGASSLAITPLALAGTLAALAALL